MFLHAWLLSISSSQHILGAIYQINASQMGKHPQNNLPTRRGNYWDNPRGFEVVGRLRRYFDPLGMEDVRTKSSLRTTRRPIESNGGFPGSDWKNPLDICSTLPVQDKLAAEKMSSPPSVSSISPIRRRVQHGSESRTRRTRERVCYGAAEAVLRCQE